MKKFVNSQKYTSTTEIMNSMKELFSDVLQQVMKAEFKENLGYEKSERVSNNEENVGKNTSQLRKKLGREWGYFFQCLFAYPAEFRRIIYITNIIE